MDEDAFHDVRADGQLIFHGQFLIQLFQPLSLQYSSNPLPIFKAYPQQKSRIINL
jgi:hypothetical protein